LGADLLLDDESPAANTSPYLPLLPRALSQIPVRTTPLSQQEPSVFLNSRSPLRGEAASSSPSNFMTMFSSHGIPVIPNGQKSPTHYAPVMQLPRTSSSSSSAHSQPS